MAFTIDAGTDMYGSKVNVEMKFQNGVPSVAELSAAVETEFDTRARANRPAGYPDTPWKCETLQVFDDSVSRWVDLHDTRQLRQKGQLWAFQPESIWHSDAQGVIPEAEKKLFTFTTPVGSPARARAAADAGVPPTLSEKLRSVFYQIDGQNKKYILREDLERAFRSCNMEFTYSTAGDLFSLADSNQSGHITYDEFVNFSIKAPQVIDALFFRFRDLQNAAPQFSAQPQSRAPISQPQPSYQAAPAQPSYQAAPAQPSYQAQPSQSYAPQPSYQPQPQAQASPQREAALRDYESARRRADEVRLAKEEAEREERNAWDRCYYSTGGSPRR